VGDVDGVAPGIGLCKLTVMEHDAGHVNTGMVALRLAIGPRTCRCSFPLAVAWSGPISTRPLPCRAGEKGNGARAESALGHTKAQGWFQPAVAAAAWPPRIHRDVGESKQDLVLVWIGEAWSMPGSGQQETGIVRGLSCCGVVTGMLSWRGVASEDREPDRRWLSRYTRNLSPAEAVDLSRLVQLCGHLTQVIGHKATYTPT
jgi:hypothetical protein